MAENLKVNAKTKILTFKKKHNLLVDGGIKDIIENAEELNLKGVLTQEKYELDEDITLSVDATTGFSSKYSHMRVSNGKLNIVLLLGHDGSTQPSYDSWIVNGQLVPIPQDIYNKLVPITSNVVLARELKQTLFVTSTPLASREVYVAINKSENNKIAFFIRYKGGNDTMVLNTEGCVRFEFNFIL